MSRVLSTTRMLLLAASAAALHSPNVYSPPTSAARSCTPLCQFTESFDDSVAVKPSGQLFQDMRAAEKLGADEQRELIEPNTALLERPNPKRKFAVKGGKKKGGGKASVRTGGGFSAGSKSLTAEQQRVSLCANTLAADGICLVENVMSKETTETLFKSVQDELARSYDAVDRDATTCTPRFNVPVETFDPLRGYLLLPLRDEKSVESNEPNGPIVSALRELLKPGSILGELFSETCGGTTAEWYDLVALRTEAGAARQPIHFDTPYQKTPGLFCAFIALHDVRYTQGTTVFLPGTHLNTPARKAFVDGQHDGRRKEMLRNVKSRYSLLKAGDAAVFDMRTLHAGTANFLEEDGGGQRLLFILTFRNRKAKESLGHAPNLRPGYRNRGITLAEMRRELDKDEPFAGIASDGKAFGDGL